MEVATCKIIMWLENKNEVMQRRFNRADIIINGLPRTQIQLREVIFKICKVLNVSIVDHDLCVCTFINNRKSVLVKFNSVIKRDLVLRSYFKKRSLRLSEIMDNDIQSSVFLNDHLTEKGSKLFNLCRKLRKEDTIAKFRMLYSDIPRVKIHFKNNTEKIFELEECFLYFSKRNVSNEPNYTAVESITSIAEKCDDNIHEVGKTPDVNVIE